MPTIEREISVSADDAADVGAFGGGTFNNNDLYYFLATANLSNRAIAGWRFLNITISSEAIIISATLTFATWAVSNGGWWKSICYGDDVDDCAVWSDPANRPKNAPLSTAFDILQGNTTDIPNGTYELRSFNVKTIIEEIIARAGWASGNDIGFITKDNGSSIGATLKAYTFDNYPDFPKPKLTIVYSIGGKTFSKGFIF